MASRILALSIGVVLAFSARAAEPPYSCKLQQDAARACAFGSCDQRELDRLTRECLRDHGQPVATPRGR
jgi:hypothetical protein